MNTKSETGRQAHEPQWWADFFEYFYPRVSLGIIDKLARENSTVKNFIRNLPSKCPFERQYWFKDTLVVYVPALCKFNPLFTQLMRLKAELCCEDIPSLKWPKLANSINFEEDNGPS